MSKDMRGIGMRGTDFVERYRSCAEKCVKISRDIPDPAGKLVLLEMAQYWLKLAELAAEGAATTVVHPTAVPNRPAGE
jgi:hypothetical protein